MACFFFPPFLRGMGVVVLLFLSPLVPASAASAATFRFPFFYEPASLDPQKDSSLSTAAVANKVFDGLVGYDESMNVIPALAESWKVSRDGCEYIFTLRRGVRFHHGREVVAEDVKASLTRMFKSADPAAPARFLERIEGAKAYRQGKAEDISGIRVLSAGEVAVRLSEPYGPFLSALAMAPTRIVPREMAQDPAAPLDRRPVGTGAFRFVSWEGSQVVLEANPDYFQGRPRLDRVVFVFYPAGAAEAAFGDFLAGKLEGCPLPSQADAAALRKKGYQVLIRPSLSLLFYGFNLKLPPYDRLEVRKALALAFDREEYTREILKGNVPASQVIPPGMPGYTPENALLRFDPAEASRLLARAGFPEGKGLPELVLASASRSPVALREIEQLVRDFRRIGVKVRPEFVDGWDRFQEGLKNGAYPFFRYAWYGEIPDPDGFLAALFESGSPVNFTGFSSPEVDRLLEKARGMVDPLQRSQLYRQAEKRVLEEVPLIPLAFLATQAVFSPRVKGMALSVIGFIELPLREVTVEEGR
jgi:oligopeptide transport system substrate-binding protein